MALTAEDRLTFQEAEEALAGGRYGEARAAFHLYLTRRLQATADDGAYLAPDAVAIERLAELSSHLGGASAAEDLLEGLAALYRRASNSLCERIAILRLAHLRLRRGALRHCLETLQRLEEWSGPLDKLVLTPEGLEIWEQNLGDRSELAGNRSAALAPWYLLVGRICAANGRYHEAKSAYEQGLRHVGSPEGSAYDSPIRLAHAHALLETGELDAALQALPADAASSTPEAIAATELMAKVDTLRGRLGEAKSGYESAIYRADHAGLELAGAALRLSLGHLLILINQTDLAQTIIHEAAKLAASAEAPELEGRARALDQVARLRRRSGLGASAIAPSILELQTEALEGQQPEDPPQHMDVSFPAQESFLGTLEDHLVQFQDALGEQALPAARSLLQRLEAFGTSDSPLVHARLAVARGLLRYCERDVSAAQEQFAAAEPVLERLELLLELRQLARYWIWWAARVEDAACVEGRRRQEEALLDRLAASLAPTDQGMFYLNKPTSDEEALGAELRALDAIQRKAGGSQWFGALYRLWRWCQVARFLQKLDDHREKRLRQALDLPELAWPSSMFRWLRVLRYPRNRATVSFLVLPDRVFAGCVWRFGGDFRIQPVSRIEVRELVRQFHQSLVNGQDAVANDVLRNLSHGLGLTSLLSALPAGVRAVGFVPDDALLGVPFAALPLGDDVALTRWAISHACEWFPEIAVRVVRSALLVAAPDPGGDLRPLTQAELELGLVEKIFGGPRAAFTRLIGAQARPTAVRDALRGTSLWHAACHGVFNPQSPGSSGIVLHGPDGVLTLRELAQLDVRTLRLAFLASCWSADNFVFPGRWVLSLPSTLHAAGAETIVGSLWEALDNVAAMFAELFYRHVRDGLPCDEAFRRAMLACREDGAGRRRPLWDWAGFVLTGTVGPLAWRNK